MEFILQLPQDIDKDGALWQIWNSFCQKCKVYQSTELHGTALMDASSLLLNAAHHQINSICSSLKMYDLDLPKLHKVLQVVEQACLPYFILLFERFRYFDFKRDLSDSVDDFAIILRKQAEICEFGNLKDNIMANSLNNSLKSESPVQHLLNTNGSHFGDNKAHSGVESSHNSIRDINAGSDGSASTMNRVTRRKDLQIYGQSSVDNHDSGDANSLPCAELKTCSSDKSRSIFKTVKERHNFSLFRGEKKIGKFTEKRNSLEIGGKARLKKSEKVQNLILEDTEIGSDVTSFEKYDGNDDIVSEHCNKTDVDCNIKLGSTLINTKTTEQNVAALKRFHCCFCEKTFAGQNCLRNHLVSKHKGYKEFSCKICTAAFFDVEEYLLHYKNEHFVEKQKPQSSCMRAVKLRVKKDIGRFNCSHCRRVFVKEGYLRRHIHYSHAKSFLCWNCEESFQSLSEYKQHSEKHVVIGRFSCDLCQRPHHNIFRLVGHLKNHLMPQNKCEICGVVFIRQESLARHIEKHIDEPVHKCKICGKNFVMEARLQYHMRTHSGEKRFTCELCGKMYAQKINLVHHKRWHAGEQPFECEICGKRTRSSGDLSKHKRKHSDKYSYVCEVCGRGFNYSSALVKHRMGHTGKRSYACEVCGRTFIYREGLRDHIKASRCPGRRSESGYNRTPRATKLLQSGISNNLMDVDTKAFSQAQPQRPDTALKDIQDWHCMIRNSEAEGGTSVVLVPSFY